MKLSKEFLAYCAELGEDTMLVQGAGGNASYKYNDVLTVKASGTWLRDSLEQSNFVSLDLPKVISAIDDGQARFDAAVLPEQSLKPSIETAMHALIPYPYVFHLHPVEVIASTVIADGQNICEQKLAELPWVWLPYYRPGSMLANAINTVLESNKPPPKIWILTNHGIIIADDTLEGVQQLLKTVMDRFPNTVELSSMEYATAQHSKHKWNELGYEQSLDPLFNSLVADPGCLDATQKHWVLYPDHAVFLGRSAPIYDHSIDDLTTFKAWIEQNNHPPLILLPKQDTILISKNAKQSELLMLECYCKILARVKNYQLISLPTEEVDGILGLESEQFRITIGR